MSELYSKLEGYEGTIENHEVDPPSASLSSLGFPDTLVQPHTIDALNGNQPLEILPYHLSRDNYSENGVKSVPVELENQPTETQSTATNILEPASRVETQPSPEATLVSVESTEKVSSPAAEPQLLLESAVAAPMFKPVFTVDHPHLLSGITLEDDPHIQITQPEMATSRFRTWMTEGFLLGRDFFFAALVAAFIVFFVVQPVKVEGTSMLPRLHDGERIFINKFVYQFQSVQRGDIVVFWYPKDPNKSFIKRVIGIPGDEVQLLGGKLRINGKEVPEPYLSKDYTTIASPSHTWVVEPHHYFVMGDNRDASNDSRSWGLVPEKYIYGKAIYRYWPFEEAGPLSDDVRELKDTQEHKPPSNE